MLRQLRTYLEFGNRFCGVEHSHKQGKEVLLATLLKRKKKALDVEDRFEAEHIGSLSELLPKNQHITLVINNDKVITKTIESELKDSQKLLFKAFPNINTEHFLYDVLSQQNKHFISICRKDYIESVLNAYKTHGFSVIGLSLGNSLISLITDWVQGDEVTTSNAQLKLDHNTITQWERYGGDNEILYNVNGLNTTNNNILSLTAALSTLLDDSPSKTNFETQKQVLISEHRQAQFFKQFLKFGLGFLLLLLLLNFFVFNHYFNTVEALKETSQFNQETKEKILTLNADVSKTQKLVEDVLKSSSSKSSYYINDIITGLPKTILLSSLNYQPLIKRVKEGQPIANDINTIVVSGKSSDSQLFSEWISDLESSDWILKVEIIDYADQSKTVSDFKLKISLSHDQ